MPDTTKPETKDAPLEDPRVADLVKICTELASRVKRLEEMAHTDHTLSLEGVEQISGHVMGKVEAYVRQTLGHSGQPSVG